MGIATDIVRAWRHPKAAMARQMQDGVREEKAFFFLMLGCLLIFVAQMPRLWREAMMDPSVPSEARLGGAMLGWLFLVPLAFYAIASLGRIGGMLFGGQGSWYSARLAMFWAVLVSAPLWMINGAVAGLVGQGALMAITGVVAVVMFAVVWFASLSVAEKGSTIS